MTENVKIRAGLFTSEDLKKFESSRPEGISSQEVISIFQARGVKLSEATFRKYVQLGLLPTSKRIGKKGKHQGSKGIYPISVVRRINLIKYMMMENMTLEEIWESFLAIQNEMERAQQSLDGLFELIDQRIERVGLREAFAEGLKKEVEQTRKEAQGVLKKIEKLSSRLALVRPQSIQEEQGGLS